MLSDTTDAKRGDGLLMSCSRASRTAAIIDAAIASVEANRSATRKQSEDSVSAENDGLRRSAIVVDIVRFAEFTEDN
jgi:hypothetical protein